MHDREGSFKKLPRQHSSFQKSNVQTPFQQSTPYCNKESFGAFGIEDVNSVSPIPNRFVFHNAEGEHFCSSGTSFSSKVLHIFLTF